MNSMGNLERGVGWLAFSHIEGSEQGTQQSRSNSLVIHNSNTM